MGCCETYQRHKAGMTTYQECRDWFIADLELEYGWTLLPLSFTHNAFFLDFY